MKLVDQKIYLASKSPRRRELLRQIGVDFELLLLRELTPRGPEVSESVYPSELAADYVTRVTREKLDCAQQTMWLRKLPLRAVLAADTTVVLDEHILGKPSNLVEATDMLRSLQNRTHQVLTSVAVQRGEEIFQITQSSDVAFGPLTDAMIRAYCTTSEPYDKAGGYAIQGLAAMFVREITGSYSGIMGLPLFETVQLLRQAGLRVL
jgi:septum formation protein